MLTGIGMETWEKRPLGGSKYMWEDNIKIDPKEVEYLAQERHKRCTLVNAVMNLRVL